jgi:hypothetical protein
MTKGEKLSQYLKSMKQNELANHRECWACIDLVVRFHLEKLTNEEFDEIIKND